MRTLALAFGLGSSSLAWASAASAQAGPEPPVPAERPYRIETEPGRPVIENPVATLGEARRAPEPQPSAWDRVGLRGIEVEVRGGLALPESKSPVLAPNLYGTNTLATGDIASGKESPYGPDPIAVGIAAGYRLFPWLSVGAFFSYATFNLKDGTDTGSYVDGTSNLERQLWTLGAYGRYYLTWLSPRLQPWIELGAGYSQDNANYVLLATLGRQGNPEAQNFLLEEEGLIVPLTVGLDWRLAPAFSVGPTVGYSRVFPLSGCASVTVDATSAVPGINNECSAPVSGHGYGVFFAGLFAKVTIGVGR
jgi:hypothetical protein